MTLSWCMVIPLSSTVKWSRYLGANSSNVTPLLIYTMMLRCSAILGGRKRKCLCVQLLMFEQLAYPVL
jgi:hypothetical protein